MQVMIHQFSVMMLAQLILLERLALETKAPVKEAFIANGVEKHGNNAAKRGQIHAGGREDALHGDTLIQKTSEPLNIDLI